MDRFRTMQSFAEVIRLGSFSEAAKTLGLSRALISRHVSDLVCVVLGKEFDIRPPHEMYPWKIELRTHQRLGVADQIAFILHFR